MIGVLSWNSDHLAAQVCHGLVAVTARQGHPIGLVDLTGHLPVPFPHNQEEETSPAPPKVGVLDWFNTNPSPPLSALTKIMYQTIIGELPGWFLPWAPTVTRWDTQHWTEASITSFADALTNAAQRWKPSPTFVTLGSIGDQTTNARVHYARERVLHTCDDRILALSATRAHLEAVQAHVEEFTGLYVSTSPSAELSAPRCAAMLGLPLVGVAMSSPSLDRWRNKKTYRNPPRVLLRHSKVNK